jgi:hypothetical protein
MGRPHKDHDLSMDIRTKLPDGRIAALCQDAGRNAMVMFGSSIRIQESTPGRLVFSVHGPGGIVELMTFEVSVQGDPARLTTRIRSYKTRQETIFGFIPVGQKKILGLKNFRSFNEVLSHAVTSEDPTARVRLDAR